MPPTLTDEQPLAFLRWAPGLAAAWDVIRNEEQERKAKQQQAESQSQQQQQGPRFNGGM